MTGEASRLAGRGGDQTLDCGKAQPPRNNIFNLGGKLLAGCRVESRVWSKIDMLGGLRATRIKIIRFGSLKATRILRFGSLRATKVVRFGSLRAAESYRVVTTDAGNGDGGFQSLRATEI
jgi:hypothetical protein